MYVLKLYKFSWIWYCSLVTKKSTDPFHITVVKNVFKRPSEVDQ